MARGGAAGLLAACVLAALAGAAQVDAKPWNSGKRVLMLLPQYDDRALYWNFISSISQYGYHVDVKGYKDPSLKLKDYDHWLYDQLVLFTPKAESEGMRDAMRGAMRGGLGRGDRAQIWRPIWRALALMRPPGGPPTRHLVSSPAQASAVT